LPREEQETLLIFCGLSPPNIHRLGTHSKNYDKQRGTDFSVEALVSIETDRFRPASGQGEKG
jgi:hypothetical protein